MKNTTHLGSLDIARITHYIMEMKQLVDSELPTPLRINIPFHKFMINMLLILFYDEITNHTVGSTFLMSLLVLYFIRLPNVAYFVFVLNI